MCCSDSKSKLKLNNHLKCSKLKDFILNTIIMFIIILPEAKLGEGVVRADPRGEPNVVDNNIKSLLLNYIQSK